MAGELILIVEDNEKNLKLVRDLLERVDGLYLFDNPVLNRNVAAIAEFALEQRLPMMSINRRYVAAGGLIA